MKTSDDAQSHFSRGGRSYAAFRPTYPDELVTELIKHAPATHLAVDVGCGTGQLTHVLAEPFDEVVGCDVSQSQIENACRRANISYRHASASQLPIEDRSTDLIVAAQSAHWFDLEPFYKEAIRLATPGALLALISYGVMEVEPPLNDLFEEFYWHDIHSYWPVERRHVETGYADLFFPFEEITCPDFSIERQWDVESLIGYIRTWSAVKAANKVGNAALFDRFSDRIKSIIGEETVYVRWPLSLRLAKL